MLETVKKYFIPNKENDYKPHIMRQASLAVISFVAILVFFAGVINVTLIQKTNLLSAVISQTLVDLANTDRSQNQIAGLNVNQTLVMAAQLKADDMASKGYFAHTSPEGKTPWSWFDVVGYNYQYAGENLAVNFSDSSDVNTAWMGSPGHRANILNGKFTEIGVATAKGIFQGRDTIFVVQMFGKPLNVVTKTKAVINSAITTVTHKASSSPAQTSLGSLGGQATNPSTTPPVVSKNVLGESENFIAVANNTTQGDMTVQANSPQGSNTKSLVSALITSPKKTVSAFYLALGVFVIISLLLMIFIEIKRQHPKLIALGIVLLVFIIVLAYIYRAMLFGPVLVV
jgi:uncharacterized protein YkwD